MLFLSYFKIYFLTTVRNTPALFFTLIFPPILLLISAHQWGSSPENQQEALIVFFNYSVQTVAFMLLGMGVSQEKNSAFAQYLRTLPVGASPMLMGRLLHTLVLSLMNLLIVGFVGVFILDIPVSLFQFCYFAAIALLGAIPFALMGITIGYIASPESSRSIFTIVNLFLLFGAFSLPSNGLFSYVREAVPTYQWRLLSQKVLFPEISAFMPVLCLAIYTVFFGLVFARVYRKGVSR